MQLIASLSAASALVATAYAASAVDLNKNCNLNAAHAKITNRCSYTVYLWSVVKTDGCPSSSMFTLAPGATYAENLQWPTSAAPSTGISIKMSKQQTCGGSDIAQLEYFLNNDPQYGGNYLDMSYIDCPGGDCPSKKEGYHFVAGNQTGKWTASSDNKWCPVIACGDANSCAQTSYILPDDPQTRTCDVSSNMELNLCGSEAPSNNPSSAPAQQAAPSSSAAAIAKPATSSALKAQAAAVTPYVELKDAAGKNVKTEVVYVTAYQTVNGKRHLHGHARRHAHFHA